MRELGANLKHEIQKENSRFSEMSDAKTTIAGDNKSTNTLHKRNKNIGKRFLLSVFNKVPFFSWIVIFHAGERYSNATSEPVVMLQRVTNKPDSSIILKNKTFCAMFIYLH